MKCESIWIVEPNKMEIRTRELGDPKYDEVQIEVKACGLCCWDSYLYQGISAIEPFPYIIGHESVGIILKVGSEVKGYKVGDKVFCTGGTDGMSQYINLSAQQICKIPDDTTDYVSYVAEPTNCVTNIMTKMQIQPGDHVVLVGAGYMGLLTLQALVRGSLAGKITVFEKQDCRIDIAKTYGKSECYNPDTEEGEARVKEIIAEGGADIVIDFSASDSGYKLATRMLLASAGKFVIGSWHRQDKSFDGTQWHLGGVTVLNLAPGSNAHYNDVVPRTGKLIERGIFTPGDLVTHTAHYTEANDLFLKSISKEDGYIKGVITF